VIADKPRGRERRKEEAIKVKKRGTTFRFPLSSILAILKSWSPGDQPPRPPVWAVT